MQENMRYVRSHGKVFAFVDKGPEGKAKGQLVGTNGMGSVLCVSRIGSGSNLMHYGPYGSRSGARSAIAYNGERADRSCEDYALGNGYRSYTPVLMRFRSPDSWSPFGQGGINAYAYCSADPINNRDPSGHMSGSAIAGITLGTLGILMSVFTIGMGAPLTASAIAGLVLGMAADILGITSNAMEDTNPQASGVIGWVALGFGLVSFGLTISGPLKHINNLRRSYSSHLEDRGFITLGDNRVWTKVHGNIDRNGGVWLSIERDSNFVHTVKYKVNIMGHGLREGLNRATIIKAKDSYLFPRDIAKRLYDLGFTADRVSEVRMLVCYSATPHYSLIYANDMAYSVSSSFIHDFKQYFPETRVIGYDGIVRVNYTHVQYSDLSLTDDVISIRMMGNIVPCRVLCTRNPVVI